MSGYIETDMVTPIRGKYEREPEHISLDVCN